MKYLPQELNPAKLETKQYGDVTAFFSRSSPFSNFYTCCNLLIDDTPYDHVEQYIQSQKAIFAEKPDLAREILGNKDPAVCKKIGDTLKIDEDEWRTIADNKMIKACKAKFSQSDGLKRMLLDTENRILAEAGPNLYWGTGLKLNNPDNGNKDKWLGQNKLGNILMSVRSELQ